MSIYLRNRSNAIARSNKSSKCTCAPSEILSQDLAAYNAGNFTKINGNILVNGREYCLKEGSKTLFPVKGDVFIVLQTEQIIAIRILKNTPQSKLKEALTGANVSEEALKFAKEFIKKY